MTHPTRLSLSRATLMVALTLVVCVISGGCGSGTSSDEAKSSGTPEANGSTPAAKQNSNAERAEVAAQRYVDAVAADDATTICRLSSRVRLEDLINQGTTCEEEPTGGGYFWSDLHPATNKLCESLERKRDGAVFVAFHFPEAGTDAELLLVREGGEYKVEKAQQSSVLCEQLTEAKRTPATKAPSTAEGRAALDQSPDCSSHTGTGAFGGDIVDVSVERAGCNTALAVARELYARPLGASEVGTEISLDNGWTCSIDDLTDWRATCENGTGATTFRTKLNATD